jgi:hypothetical protein
MRYLSTICSYCSSIAMATLLLVGCDPSPGGSPQTGTGGKTQSDGSGGTTSSGGTVGGGGTSSLGGSVASSGTTSSGGTANSGGSAGTGGAVTGGATATGGRQGSGGSPGTGGLTGDGGKTSTGGTQGMGGRTGAGGYTGLGGTTASPGTGGRTTGTGGTAATGTGGRGTGGASGTGGATGAGGSTGAGGFTPPTAKNSVAYTGCSMANNIGNGNKRVGNGVMWNSDSYGTGAMVVQNWTSSSSSSWSLFDQKMNSIGGKNTVKAIVVQICIFSSRATDDEVKQMIAAAKAHTNPGTHIYLVGQPQYEAGHECSLAGNGGAKWTDDEAKKIAADSSVGSDVSYLGQFILNSTKGEVMSDTCHATSSGEDVMARQANAFFPAR